MDDSSMTRFMEAAVTPMYNMGTWQECDFEFYQNTEIL